MKRHEYDSQPYLRIVGNQDGVLVFGRENTGLCRAMGPVSRFSESLCGCRTNACENSCYAEGVVSA